MQTLKKLLVAVTVFLLIFCGSITAMTPQFVLAASLSGADKLISLGMPDTLARYFAANLVSVNSSGNLVLAVATGKKLSVTVAGVEKMSLSSSGLLTTAGGQTATTGDETVTAGDFIAPTASKGLVAGEAARAANVTTATTAAAPIYASGAAASYDLAAFVGSGVSASGATLDLFKTRATTGAATTIVNSGDIIGQLKFFGANGTTYDPAAAIIVKSDATPGASADMPGSIDLQTTPDGSATLASVLKLTNDKAATFAGQIRSATGNEEAVAGAGTNQGNAGTLSSTKNFHQLTGANGTVGWTFGSALVAGDVHFLMNTTAGVPLVYAPTGGTCNGGGANAACTLVTGIGGHICFATSASALICG